MTTLSTHVLDTAHGGPAAGVAVRLFDAHLDRHSGEGRNPVASQGQSFDSATQLGSGLRRNDEVGLVFDGVTDASGRCPGLQAELPPGRYRLEFAVGDYFRARGVALAEPPFLNIVAIVFGLAEADGHYHVPLLVAPYGYSTYRGG